MFRTHRHEMFDSLVTQNSVQAGHYDGLTGEVDGREGRELRPFGEWQTAACTTLGTGIV
jgi:hypothetical protein